MGIAPSTCLERIRLLRRRSVIRGHHAHVALPALNRGGHVDFPLPVCPEHLGPSLPPARTVLWPPEIRMIG